MSNVSKLKKKAADFEQKKQFDRAVQAYIELLDALANDIDDADIPLYNRVGDILIRQNSAAEALVYYEKAVDLYSERGFLNNAIALCNKILRQSPGRTIIYYKLGKISATKGFKSDAKRNFLEYADRMEKGGKRDEAFRALKEFADLCPDQDDVRLMLAEHLARDNRREEAIEQLQTLHSKFETEGRSAEARATLDRMKSIDPNVEPRPSGNFQTIKSNELVFLDVDDLALPARATPSEPVPSSRAPEEIRKKTPPPEPAISSSNSALDGLSLTFVPDEAVDEITSPDLIDGFTPTGEHTSITPGGVARLDDFETGRAEPADVDVAFPSLIDIPAIPEEEDAASAERIDVENFADETLSGSEFAALELEPLDSPVEERLHDLALPSDLPLLRFTGDVPVVDAEEQAGGPAASDVSDDLDAEIMSPIMRSTRTAAIDDQAFELAEEEHASAHDSLDAHAAALDDEEAGAKEPNEEEEEEPGVAESVYPMAPRLADATPLNTGAIVSTAPPEHPLEWEDLAAAAAQHDVEPVEVPATPAPAVGAVVPIEDLEPEIDQDFLDRPPTFGVDDGAEETSFSPSPLSPDALAPEPPLELPVTNELEAAIADLDAELLDAEQPSPPAPRVERRTPPRALEAIATLDTLRAQILESPNDPRLRRRLAEALLEMGEREQGLRELDAAMLGVEREGDLETARDIAKEILLLVPESVRHHQKSVEYAARSGDRLRLIDAYLALADALFRGGEHDKARAVYGRVVELEPNEPRARSALEMLAGRLSGVADSAPAAQTRAAPEGDLESTDGDPTFEDLELEDLDAEVAAAFGSPDENGEDYGADDGARNAGVFQTPAFVPNGDFIDLGAMLRGDQPQKSTRMVVGDAKPTGDEQADFEDMLRRFKQGVAANVDDEDFDSHYDLGVAFKEMGLIDDAIAQFQKALRSDTHRSRAYEALGQCFIEKNQHQVAATLLTRAVETTRVDDRVLVGSLYLLAYACEQLQRERDALVYYHRVFAVDVDFRDVATRIQALESKVA
ncbi:MAG TPA: tetratricopeptide repeat protein [Gemmatimonadaceae bacterium]|jgi:tetratricopeptide (TPR) repeat protein